MQCFQHLKASRESVTCTSQLVFTCNFQIPSPLSMSEICHIAISFLWHANADFCRISRLRADADHLGVAQIRCFNISDAINLIPILCTFNFIRSFSTNKIILNGTYAFKIAFFSTLQSYNYNFIIKLRFYNSERTQLNLKLNSLLQFKYNYCYSLNIIVLKHIFGGD